MVENLYLCSLIFFINTYAYVYVNESFFFHLYIATFSKLEIELLKIKTCLPFVF